MISILHTKFLSVSLVLDRDRELRNSILGHPNAEQSKNVAAKSCNVVHKARYVFLSDVVRVNHFRVHNLQKSRDILTDPMVFRNLEIRSLFHMMR